MPRLPLPPDGRDVGVGTYGVTVDDVAAELPTLLPHGVSADSTPDRALVRSWIASADAFAGVRVRAIDGLTADPTAPGADVVRRFVIARVKHQIVRVLYQGNPAADATIASYATDVAELDAQMVALGLQLVGTAAPVVRVGWLMPTRTPLIPDAAIDGARTIHRLY